MAVDTIVYVVFYGSRTVPMLGLSSNFSTFKCLLKPLPSLFDFLSRADRRAVPVKAGTLIHLETSE